MHPRNTKVQTLLVFIVNINGEERIILHPENNIPMVYLSTDALKQNNPRELMHALADKEKVYIELREYTLVKETTEFFYPSAKTCNA